MKDKKIAFVHYPHATDSARLETMPFALNIVLSLIKSGWSVDVFLWEKPGSNYRKLFGDDVKLNYFQQASSAFPNKLIRFCERRIGKEIAFRLKFSSFTDYHCVFGLGQFGSYVASLIANASRCPFVFINDEFPTTWSESRATRLEQQAANRADYVIVPDAQRFMPLCQELPVLGNKPYSMLPNMPLLDEIPIEIDWKNELKVPSNNHVFLHAGSISDWTQIPELLSTLPCWPKNTVLLLQSRGSSDEVDRYRKQLSHLDLPERIMWNTRPLPDWKLNSLVSFSSGNFALYRNLGSNIENMGFSSGKLMRSIAFGSPVIASNFASLSFVREHHLGVLIDHPMEISSAVKEISENRDFYSQNCKEFCQNHLSFERAWESFCSQAKQTIEINFQSP